MTVHGRVLLVNRIVAGGWRVADAARAAGISERTAYKWLARFRAGGERMLHDRSSAPGRMPHATPVATIEAVEGLRRRRLSGPAIARELGLTLKDGTRQDADLIVMATGYRSQQDTVRAILGDEIADKVGPVWDLDETHELRNMWRPTAQPGMWFTGGGLGQCRIYSKYIALQIKRQLAIRNRTAAVA
ncbi:leucine zipper domain-containing protein [Chelatococcus asaccharovorans]